MEHDGEAFDVILYRLSGNDPIYPGTAVNLHAITIKVEHEGSGSPYLYALEDFELRYWVFARFLTATGTIVVPREAIKI